MTDGGKSGTIITLVHGTWAGAAKWIEPDSDFCDQLRSRLIGKVSFLAFRWTGKNTHPARTGAGQALGNHILRTKAANPDAQQLIIAHSHGGNVALYALNSPDVAEAVAGVIAMATPFLRLKPRHVEIPLAIISRVLGFLGFFFALGVVLKLGMTISSSLPVFYGWKGVAAALIFLVVGLSLIRLLWGLCFGLAKLLEEAVADWLSEKQDRLIQRLRPVAREKVPMLAVRFSLDEAGLYLRFVHALSEPLPVLARLFSLIAFALFGIACLLTTAGLVLGIPYAVFDWPYQAELYYNRIWAVAVGLFVMSIVWFFIFQTGALILPWIVRGPLGYGPEGPLAAMLVRVQSYEVPDGPTIESKQYSLGKTAGASLRGASGERWLSPTLIHSLVYTSTEVIDDVASWIKRLSVANS